MTSAASRALLPSGLRDILAPGAAHEAQLVETMMALIAGRGYDRVKPPLMEFENSLLSGSGAAMAEQSFRLMDPASHRMLAVRADMTLQIARIASTRLSKTPRPLRLAYAGQVLRVRGNQLHPERQFGQVGAELIGSASAKADAELILMAVEALTEVGMTELSVDLAVPALIREICNDLGLETDIRLGLRDALNRKDPVAVRALVADPVFEALMAATGPVDAALAALKTLHLPDKASLLRDDLLRIIDLLQAQAPDLQLTVDPVESRGFEYHTGVTFALFTRHGGGELGRGGRYVADGAGLGSKEPASGLTLFMNAILRVLGKPTPPLRLYLPFATDAGQGVALRASGWVTVCGLEAEEDPQREAVRLGCSHIWRDGVAHPLDQPKGT